VDFVKQLTCFTCVILSKIFIFCKRFYMPLQKFFKKVFISQQKQFFDGEKTFFAVKIRHLKIVKKRILFCASTLYISMRKCYNKDRNIRGGFWDD